jgi:hypothetical protein
MNLRSAFRRPYWADSQPDTTVLVKGLDTVLAPHRTARGQLCWSQLRTRFSARTTAIMSYRDGTMLTMDDHYLQVWREQARGLGLPGPAVDQWLGLARPALALHEATDDPAAADAPIVGYRGGRPSLPPDIDWSGAPDFTASVDCAALPPDLPGFPSPRTATSCSSPTASTADRNASSRTATAECCTYRQARRHPSGSSPQAGSPK